MALQCAGAGMSGELHLHPECNKRKQDREFEVVLTDGKVTSYRWLDQVQDAVRAPLPVSTEPEKRDDFDFEKHACNDAMRRYEMGAITYNQMKDACR